MILKPKHNYIGKNLIPVILRLKAEDGTAVGDDQLSLARLKKEYSLEDYTLVELRMEFERVTGE